MEQSNKEIRKTMRLNGLTFSQVANEMKLDSAASLARMMRVELDQNEKRRITSAVNKLIRERNSRESEIKNEAKRIFRDR